MKPSDARHHGGMVRNTLRRIFSVAALVLLTGGIAHADIGPPPDDDKDGGCLVVGAPLALAPLGLGIALALRRRRG